MSAANPLAAPSRGPGPQQPAQRFDPTPSARSRAGAERLGALDASFLHLETPTTAMHVGAVATFAAPADQHGGCYPRLLARVGARIGSAPRYRQKLRWVPGRFVPPVWVDDPDFDVRHQLRRHILPAPGGDAQLAELAARLQSQQLDRSRPVWELHLVEGLSENRFALIIKIHHALVDGIGGLDDLGRLFFDQVPAGGTARATRILPAGRPVSTLRLIVDGLADLASRPAGALAALPTDPAGIRAAAVDTLRRVGGLPAAAATILRPAPDSPLNTGIGVPRQLASRTCRQKIEEAGHPSGSGRRGSVRQADNGSWYFVVDITEPGGHRRQTRRRGFATRRAAQAALTRTLQDLAGQTYVAPFTTDAGGISH